MQSYVNHGRYGFLPLIQNIVNTPSLWTINNVFNEITNLNCQLFQPTQILHTVPIITYCLFKCTLKYLYCRPSLLFCSLQSRYMVNYIYFFSKNKVNNALMTNTVLDVVPYCVMVCMKNNKTIAVKDCWNPSALHIHNNGNHVQWPTELLKYV